VGYHSLWCACVHGVVVGLPNHRVSSGTSSGSPIYSSCAGPAAEQPHRPRVDLDQVSVFPAGPVGSSFEQDTEVRVASIRSVHGKRLTSSVPLDELFNTPTTTSVGHLPTGRAQLRTYDYRPTVNADNTTRRSSVDCHPAYRQQLLAFSTQHASNDNSTSSSCDRISTLSGIQHLNAHSWAVNNVCPIATDHRMQSCSTAGSRQSEHVLSGQSAASTSGCVSSVRGFGRRRRPVSVMEFTARMLPAPPAPPPPPPPPARKPPLPDHISSQMDSSRTSQPSNPRNFHSVQQLQQLALSHVDGDVMLCDGRQQNESELTRDYNDAVTLRSTKSSIPVAHSTDLTRTNCDHTTDRSVLKTSLEVISVERPDSVYAVPTIGTQGDRAGQSEVCTDIGSFAQRLSQLKTFYERPGGRLLPDVPASSTHSTAGDRNSCRYDVVSSVTCPNEPRLYQQDSILTHTPASTTTVVSEIGDLAKLGESLNLENKESVGNDEILLPPPPEFDDSFNVPEPNCFAMSACDSASVGDASVDCWSAEEVCKWLDAVGLCEHCASFRMKNVTGVQLRTLGRSELIALGLTDVHERMEFERALRKLLHN